jgi:DNA (cytosine-5)-methyltransferase 1
MFSGIGGFEYGIESACNKQSAEVKQDGKGRNGNADEVERDVLPTIRPSSLCIGYSEIDKYATAIYDYHYGKISQKETQQIGQENTQGLRTGESESDNERDKGLGNSGTETQQHLIRSADRQFNYGGHKNYRNATRIDPAELPDFDLLVGGFPCQAFSIAGKRLGFDDTRGTLFFEIARVLKVKRPKHFILENVKGLLSHDNGGTFKTIILTLVELGYDIEWQVLNSKNHGVPQNRERVFIVGHLGAGSCPKVFPIGESVSGDIERVGETKIAGSLTGGGHSGGHHSTMTIIKESQKLPDAMRIRETDGCSVTLKGEGGGMGAKTRLYAVLTPNRAEKRQNGRRFKEDGEPSFTLTGQDIHGVFNGTRIRRLTPIECERLQSFPDNWTKYGVMDGKVVEISDSQRYKCLGNAVTTNVITEIVKRLFGGNQ